MTKPADMVAAVTTTKILTEIGIKAGLAEVYAGLIITNLEINDRQGAALAVDRFLGFAREISSLEKKLKEWSK